MTQEQKAKRYDEAIERAKSLLSGNQLGNAWIYKLLPELTESEDEKIRKDIIDKIADHSSLTHYDPSKYFAWLKKQGEQKSAWSEEDEKIYQSILDDTVTETQLGDKQITWLKSLKDRVQPQQNQEWSEEDEKHLNNIINRTKAFGDSSLFGLIKGDIDWLKSLRPQSTWKPNKEQMKALKLATELYSNVDLDVLERLYQQLKEL